MSHIPNKNQKNITIIKILFYICITKVVAKVTMMAKTENWGLVFCFCHLSFSGSLFKTESYVNSVFNANFLKLRYNFFFSVGNF